MSRSLRKRCAAKSPFSQSRALEIRDAFTVFTASAIVVVVTRARPSRLRADSFLPLSRLGPLRLHLYLLLQFLRDLTPRDQPKSRTRDEGGRRGLPRALVVVAAAVVSRRSRKKAETFTPAEVAEERPQRRQKKAS